MFAVIAPPQSSLAQDVNNDLIPGGFTTQAQAVDHCNRNDFNFATILKHFGVTCQALAAGKIATIGSRDHNNQLYSMGRLPYAKQGEYAEAIPGAGTFYMRPLWSWDTGAATTYKAIVGTRADGTFFKVLFNCGNLTIIKTTPPPPPPKNILCDNLTLSVAPGSRIKKDTVITARGKATGTNLPKGELVDFWYDAINVSTNAAFSPPTVGARGVAFTNNVATDPNTHSYTMSTPGHYLFRLSVKYEGGTKQAAGSGAGACARDVFVEQPPTDVCTEIPGVQTSRDECDVCLDIPGVQTSTSQCKPCDKSQNANDQTACLVLAKAASNNTQNIAKADGTTAQAGDVITYTLSVANSGKSTVKKFVVEENISDILDYADVTDYHGGTKDANSNVIRWPATDVPAGQAITKQLTVKIKNPLPSTPTPPSNPGKYDMTMTNVYGNAINIKLPPTVVKTTEQATTTMPNTGPGMNIFIGVALVIITGYFFARSRLLSKEIDIIRTEYAVGA
jgi:uncharacterized repeat protein (TIGR01451 family)